MLGVTVVASVSIAAVWAVLNAPQPIVQAPEPSPSPVETPEAEDNGPSIRIPIPIPSIELPQRESPRADESPENAEGTDESDQASPIFPPEWRDRPSPREEDPPANTDSPREPDNSSTIYSGGRIPGLPTGMSERDVIEELGEPSRTQDGYWPGTRSAIYELVPNQITLAYQYDQESDRIRQTEAGFAQSVDPLMMRVTLNGMLDGKLSRSIEEGLTQVRNRELDRYEFQVGDLEGVIERNERDRIYIGVWEEDLH